MQDRIPRLLLIARDPAGHVQEERQKLQRFLGGEKDVSVTIVSSDDQDGSPEKADLVVVLGGDGAILRACRSMGFEQRPILGVNLGRLGFLAELSPEQFRQRFGEIRRREYFVTHHLMLECVLKSAKGNEERFLGLNEAAVLSGGSLSMLDVELSVDQEVVTTYSGDGLIISTPVGSTAHSLSAGGPILKQDLQAFVVTPVCPHTLTNRPLVDSAECVFQMRVLEPKPGAQLVVDGQHRRGIEAGDVIEVRKAGVTFQLARLRGETFYRTLHRKLGWGGQPIYRPRQ